MTLDRVAARQVLERWTGGRKFPDEVYDYVLGALADCVRTPSLDRNAAEQVLYDLTLDFDPKFGTDLAPYLDRLSRAVR